MLRVLPVAPAGTFKFPAWIGIIFLHNSWYLWLILCHIFIVVVDFAIVAVACDP
jgi:hypothetical protein